MTSSAAQIRILVALAAALLAGWLVILGLHHFTLTPGAVFLVIGWTALCLGVLFLLALWQAVITPVPNEGFVRRRDRREDLEIEKRSLLKAIKEVEFDHEAGKMSDGDANDMIKLYRARAIEILKELDAVDSQGKAETPRAEIERELQARLLVAGSSKERA